MRKLRFIEVTWPNSVSPNVCSLVPTLAHRISESKVPSTLYIRLLLFMPLFGVLLCFVSFMRTLYKTTYNQSVAGPWVFQTSIHKSFSPSAYKTGPLDALSPRTHSRQTTVHPSDPSHPGTDSEESPPHSLGSISRHQACSSIRDLLPVVMTVRSPPHPGPSDRGFP